MKPSTGYKPVLFVTCLSASLVPLMGSALNLALPYINADFSLNAGASGWIMASYLLSTAVFQIPAARLADIFGQRKVFILGVLLFMVSSVLCGLAGSGASLIAFRFFSGIGSSMMFATNMAILTAVVPAEKRGWALGLNAGTVYFSLAAGPFVGGFLTERLGWHSIFFLAALMSLPVLAGALTLIRQEWKSEKKGTFDYTGTVVYAAGLFSLIYGFSRLPDVTGFLLTVAGLALLLFFGRFELRREHPVFNVRIFLRNRVFRHASVSALINYSATTSMAFMLSLYLQYVRGLTPTGAGLILVGQSIVMALVSLWSGKLSDKMPAGKIASAGMMIIAVGLVALCFLSATTSYVYIFTVLALIGLGFGIFSSPNTNVIMSSVEKSEYGLASATTGTMRLVGQAFSMGLAMMAMSLTIGKAPLSAMLSLPLTDSLRITFAVSAALCFFGVYSSSVMSRPLNPPLS
ncbi:Spectinomycin tetracycline efflux pump [Bacteroidales bacterium Barb6XT]|nr:Spectinomycin tetracycline efflux pump [Bacteroidales bacterium Barb6XT]